MGDGEVETQPFDRGAVVLEQSAARVRERAAPPARARQVSSRLRSPKELGTRPAPPGLAGLEQRVAAERGRIRTLPGMRSCSPQARQDWRRTGIPLLSKSIQAPEHYACHLKLDAKINDFRSKAIVRVLPNPNTVLSVCRKFLKIIASACCKPTTSYYEAAPNVSLCEGVGKRFLKFRLVSASQLPRFPNDEAVIQCEQLHSDDRC